MDWNRIGAMCPLRRRTTRRRGAPAYRHANSPQVVGNTALALHPFVIEAAAPETVRDVVVPISEPVTIMELRESMCRWPIGDPGQSEFRFWARRNCRAKDHIAPVMRASPIKPNMTSGASGGRKAGPAPSPYDCWA